MSLPGSLLMLAAMSVLRCLFETLAASSNTVSCRSSGLVFVQFQFFFLGYSQIANPRSATGPEKVRKNNTTWLHRIL